MTDLNPLLIGAQTFAIVVACGYLVALHAAMVWGWSRLMRRMDRIEQMIERVGDDC